LGVTLCDGGVLARRRRWREIQQVTNPDIRRRSRSRGELDDRFRARRHRDSPRRKRRHDANGPSVAVDEDHIDRESHPDRMHSLAG
jgi:hypothetical protein